MSQAITKTGAASHKELYNILNSILTDLTALKAALATHKTTVDELVDDHATFKTVVDANKVAVNAVITAAATNIAAVAAVAAVASSAPATLTAAKPTAMGALNTISD